MAQWAVAEVLLRMLKVPHGKLHRSGGMLADSKHVNGWISDKLMRATLNWIQR